MPDSWRQKITPPMLARRWGIANEKVLGWIRSGELNAIDAAAVRGGRPRYLIDESDIAEFERKRSVTVTPTRAPRSKRKRNDVIEFF